MSRCGHSTRQATGHAPFDAAVVFASTMPFGIELDTSPLTVLALYFAQETNRALHVLATDIKFDGVSNLDPSGSRTSKALPQPTAWPSGDRVSKTCWRGRSTESCCVRCSRRGHARRCWPYASQARFPSRRSTSWRRWSRN